MSRPKIPHRDRNDKPVQVDSRCRRYLKDGTRVKAQVIVKAIHDDGRVEYEAIPNLMQGTTRLELLEVLYSAPGNTPRKVLQYQLDKEAVRQASEICKKRNRGRKV